MKRKDFIKTSSLLLAAGVASPYMSCIDVNKQSIRKNWAGNYTYKAPHFSEPSSVEELQALVKKTGQLKTLASRHCFNDMADSPTNQVSTRKLNRMLQVDAGKNTVLVEGGA